mmetsp:Transcript_32202/g.68944  ORF Transcript_32202/g.68944 Transcript_32202/m.68944 type:complete len:382 (+) Transcript_32202:145-1290(+)|eukprot:CAMPEP_0206459896 /NCGR_PEP_ID=MMETSP0324_2-20121206/24442_1 /ASSEMBLY_ACC=CAM_ASM_000836 /TAXON_ID=2866 /ORGANISM="Crypthecodinium cohnii, Strain Seligo" /LENGTH=381 /DNA_ID=CAMNT_0053931521 /DNA_START=71 /DNA_END=1216 /DNA_ORIENTATION=-
MASWLDSLPGGIEEEDATADPASGSTGKQQDPEPKEESGKDAVEEAAEFLQDFGFSRSNVLAALRDANNDADEALLLLRQRLEEKQAAKRPRTGDDIIEVDGYQCRLKGRRLILHLPKALADGPVVGRMNADRSLLFDGVDEWTQELYHAAPPRADPSVPPSFDPAAAEEALLAGGAYVCENFASAEEVMESFKAMEELKNKEIYSSALADTSATEKARTDKVTFLTIHGKDSDCPPAMQRLYQRLEGAAAALKWPKNEQLLMPNLGMASIYDANGSHYAAHRDNERGSNNRWMNYRALTMIVYVNPTGFQSAEDGGQLRCHLGAAPTDVTGKTAKEVKDIAPRGGVMALFDSRVVLHEVLPSHLRRYAQTLWLLSAPKQH